jgi:hypothetical protein
MMAADHDEDRHLVSTGDGSKIVDAVWLPQ